MQPYYIFLRKQHIGKPAEPIVGVGDKVQRGQCIARIPEGFLGANLHSSIDGLVECITEESIQIKADQIQSSSYLPLEGESVASLIRNSGLVGMGGAGFPTYEKIKNPLKKEGLVIVNAAECEPILHHNVDRIIKDAGKIVRGLKYAMEAVGVSHGVIAIKEKYQEAAKAIQSNLEDESINLHLLSDYYPMGEERAIIREVTEKLLKVNQLPLEADAVVLNAETIYRIAEAVEEKKPVITKDITVAGRIQNEKVVQVILDVPIGTTVASVLEQVGGVQEEHGELIMGGPFTGKRTHLDDPITKISGGIIATMPFIKEYHKLGLLVCACGATKERMEEIAASMGAQIVGIEYCKQAISINGNYKCENPGKCPGQSQKVLSLKKAGAEALLIGNCTDCSNTVMSIAPTLKMPVHHITDGALRAVGERLIRKVHLNNE